MKLDDGLLIGGRVGKGGGWEKVGGGKGGQGKRGGRGGGKGERGRGKGGREGREGEERVGGESSERRKE